ncbi:MAG: serine hydrolase domain-containing protein [Bacteroidota bacterium]
MKKTFLAFIVSIVATAQTSQSQTVKDQFLAAITKEIQRIKIPGAAVVVIKNNKVLISEPIGLAEVAFSVPVDENTIFSINSIAKVFAGTAIMQLVEAKKVNVSDPIANYLNNLPEKWQKVTVTQLLNHTSGLPDIEDLENGGLIGGKGEDFAWKKVQKEPLQFEAGERFSYNATNYLLIQKIIEKISGMSYLVFLQKNQFDPVGISEKVIFGNSFDVVKNKTTTYIYYLKNKLTNEYVKSEKLYEIKEELSPILQADTGAFTTATALSKWLLALEKGIFISDNSKKQMWTPLPMNNGKYGGFGDLLNAYAYGWPVIQRTKHPAIAPIGGGRASLIVYPKDNLTIILLTNLTGSSPQEIIEKVAHFYWE